MASSPQPNPQVYDLHEQELLACVHCGFCLNSCPTYLVTGSEADSPRGRIVMMRALHDGGLSPSDPSVRKHLDACLGCRACEPACPSGVRYGSLIEHARAELNQSRPIVQRFARGALLNTLAHPERTAAAGALAHLCGAKLSTRALTLLQSDGVDDAPPALPLPALSDSADFAPLPDVIPAVGPVRARVGMLAGCAMRTMYGHVNRDTAMALAANGCEVVVGASQGCCGALHLHNGEPRQGRSLAARLIESFGSMGELDAIVVNSAGCGSTMKEYGALFERDTNADVARAFAVKCRDFSEFLDELGWIAPLRPVQTTAAYHDACHLAHAQRITAAPRRLLELIPGLTLVPLAEPDICCGSAGIYNLTEPTLARQLQSRKLDRIEQSGATLLLAANPGCLSWIASGLAERGGTAIETAHPATVLRRALANPPVLGK